MEVFLILWRYQNSLPTKRKESEDSLYAQNELDPFIHIDTQDHRYTTLAQCCMGKTDVTEAG